MKKQLSVLAAATAATLALAACGPSDNQPASITDPRFSVQTEQGVLHGAPEPHVQFQKAYARPSGGGGANMIWHNGAILTTNQTQAIFWGSQWSNASFAGDKVSGLDSFFQGFGGSGYADASTEYTGTNGQVTASSTYLGHVFDASAAPSGAPSVSQAVAEVCKVTNNAPQSNALYLLYTSTGAGNVNYCAWHSYGSCSNGAAVQVAYMPNIDGIGGCDPQDTYGTGHSQGLAALANVTAHELSETITDPRNGGWYDRKGQENGDKCAWSFDHVVTLSNNSHWKLQMEWSNAAYSAGTGLLNRSGQPGCLQG